MTSPEPQIYCFLYYFADDTSVFIEGTNYNKMFDILNKELKQVDIWLKANKLTINTKRNSLYDVSPYTNQKGTTSYHH